MSLLCSAGAHSPRPTNVQNRGLHFSSCRRCGRDMIRVAGDWKCVPPGFRIVWKTRRQAEPLIRELPMITALRTAAPLRASGPSVTRTYRGRSGLAQLPFLSLSIFLWYCADSFRKWRGACAAGRFEEAEPLRLTAR